MMGLSFQAWSDAGTVEQAGIQHAANLSSPDLATLKSLVASAISTKNTLSFIALGLKIDRSYENNLASVVSGRFNSSLELDLSIPDSEANEPWEIPNNSGLTATMFSPMYCAENEGSNHLNAEIAIKFLMPFDSEDKAEAIGLKWKQENIDKTIGLLTKMVSSCQYDVAEIQLVGKNMTKLSLLTIRDSQTSEVLLLGLLWK